MQHAQSISPNYTSFNDAFAHGLWIGIGGDLRTAMSFLAQTMSAAEHTQFWFDLAEGVAENEVATCYPSLLASDKTPDREEKYSKFVCAAACKSLTAWGRADLAELRATA